jgi:hypothetical protein
MRKINNFKQFLNEKRMTWSEVAQEKQNILDYFEKQKSKIGKMFGPKDEEEAKQRTLAKFGNIEFAKELLDTGEVKSKYAGAGDVDGMRHDDEFGKPWDDFNAPYHGKR